MSANSGPGFQAPPQVGNRPANTQRQYKRSYMACIRCRQTKAKCEISPDSASCVKCLRERRECVFTAERSTKKRKYSGSLGHINGKHSVSTTSASSPVQPEDLAPPRSDPRQNQAARRETGGSGYESDVVRTVVATSHDALGLLFKAVEQQEADEGRNSRSAPDLNGDDSPATVSSIRGLPITPSTLVPSTSRLLDLWRKHRFVRYGWLSAQEATTYVELFFRNILPLSPLASALSVDSSRGAQFILEEPLLSSTVLTISTRYHILSGMSGASRAEFLHKRLWNTCQSLIQRLLFGQDKFPASTRSIGSIKALLLLTEWFPRALHFPPENEGWDASLAIDATTDVDQSPAHGSSDKIKWREEVFEPAKRSDKMSWTLLGLATTLAHELCVFEECPDEDAYEISPEARVQMRRLLFLYVSQLSLRLGCSSPLPREITSTLSYPAATWQDPISQDWHRLIDLWIEITKLRKATTDMCFPSKSSTKNLIGVGRYSTILEHFRPLLAQWHNHYDEFQPRTLHHSSKLMVFLDYAFVRMYTNSLAIQAVVERAKTKMPVTALDYDFLMKDNHHDYVFIQEVVESCRNVLQIAVDLAEGDVLRFCPVRVFVSITSASVFLLKAISLGTRRSELQISLEVLDKCIYALKTNICDDIHLSSRYGMLLERHVRKFRHNFQVHSNIAATPADTGRRPSIADVPAPTPPPVQQQQHQPQPQATANGAYQNNRIIHFDDSELQNGFPTDMDDWLAQPFDASFAPFGTDIDQGITGMDMGSLDFLWNIPAST
ncbi:Transcriptional activator ARO80 [Cyphellophora attinorum]|uniref:Transcriptional activator ARO80 n=1 Tax=Cyphellophora attinorum TaxID=1664694 RepID=A0A0N0NRZ4_9EURO|nr:Transcriptional activator ARO80 [Phialophora attinorum]KPI45661.1 Transcriptional activator ARO80 [Phialophora attinorum]